MKLVGLIDEDFVNYKKPCMTLMFPLCISFKCDKECGLQVCQNSVLAKSQNINISSDKLINRYLSNDITTSVCFQGLEPMDSFDDLIDFVHEFRKVSKDDVVIYTGYNEDEIQENINLCKFQTQRVFT